MKHRRCPERPARSWMMPVLGAGHLCSAVARMAGCLDGCWFDRQSLQVVAYGNDRGVDDHDGEHRNQCDEHAHSIPSARAAERGQSTHGLQSA